MSINIAICDDEMPQREYLSKAAALWARERLQTINISTFDSAEAFLFSEESYDILLLDIQMGGKSGIELAKELRVRDDSLIIIFITAIPDFVHEGYDVSALHYLMKPVDEKKLFSILDKGLIKLNKSQQTLIVGVKGDNIRLPLNTICYAESFGHMMEIVTVEGKYTTRMSISELIDMAGDSFFRCHRSYVVNLQYVKRVSRTELILDTGNAIPVSRRLYDSLNHAFIEYYSDFS